MTASVFAAISLHLPVPCRDSLQYHLVVATSELGTISAVSSRSIRPVQPSNVTGEKDTGKQGKVKEYALQSMWESVRRVGSPTQSTANNLAS